MSSVQIEQKNYEMPPRDGFAVTHFITVADPDGHIIEVGQSIDLT
jgi:hypothetical protein